MTDLITWLRAIYDERERVARSAIGPVGPHWKAEGSRVEVVGDTKGRSVFEWTVCFDEGSPTGEEAEHIADNDPAYVLADLDAKRRILDEYEKAFDRRRRHPEDLASAGALLEMVSVVKLLALPHAIRPDCRDEWAVTE